MKQELSSLELQCLVKEFQILVGGKIDKIYQPEKEELLLQIYQQGAGKHLLRILSGKFIYLAKTKTESPQKPFGYCIFLRKHLNGAAILSISQVASERIIKIIFETKREGKLKKFNFYAELFGKGNLILCDEHDMILSPLETQMWKDRIVRAKQQYIFPKQAHDFRTITKEEFHAMLQGSSSPNVVRSLALDLGLGGVYAEELCLRAKVDKETKPALPSLKEAALFQALAALCQEKIIPCMVMEGKNVFDIVPFSLHRYAGKETKLFQTFSEALDAVLSEQDKEIKAVSKQKTASKVGDKLQVILDAQTKQVERMRKEADECQRSGEIIYEQYHLVDQILKEINTIRQKHSWKAIKEKLKGHKLIKDVDEKTGKITVEL